MYALLAEHTVHKEDAVTHKYQQYWYLGKHMLASVKRVALQVIPTWFVNQRDLRSYRLATVLHKDRSTI